MRRSGAFLLVSAAVILGFVSGSPAVAQDIGRITAVISQMFGGYQVAANAPADAQILAFDGTKKVWTNKTSGAGLPDPVTAAHGGTGTTTNTAHGVLLGEGTSAVVAVSPVASGSVLASAGATTDPAMVGLSALLDQLGGSTVGGLLARTSTGWAPLAAGTATQVLTSNGPGVAPTYQAAGGGTLAGVLAAGKHTGANDIDVDFSSPNFAQIVFVGASTNVSLGSDGADGLVFASSGHGRAVLDASGNFNLGYTGATVGENATSANTPWPFLATCNGVPTGTPTSYTGASAVAVDRADGSFYAYYASAWHNLSGSGGGYPPALTAETSGFTAAANNAYTNTGASADLIGTLPAAPAIGTVVDFFVTVAHKLEVLAPASVTIYAGATSTGAAGFIESSTIGSTAHCTYVATNTWVVLIGGTWIPNG